MKFNLKYSFKLIFLFLLLVCVSCSKNFPTSEINLSFPSKIAKIEGNHAIFIKKNFFHLNQNISSDDCESWSLNLDLENLFIESYTILSNKMFKKVSLFRENFDESFLKNKLYNSVLILEKNTANLDFKTVGNKGKFKITLDSNFKVKGDRKEVNNNLNSQQTWEKNIYLNCRLDEGAKKATEEAFKSLINQAYSNIYESVFTVTR